MGEANLETLSKKRDGNQEMKTKHEKMMGIRTQQTHIEILGEKVGIRDNLEYNE